MSEKKQSNKKKALKIVGIILAVVVVLLAIAAGLVKYYLSKIERFNPEDDYTLSAEEIQQMEEDLRREEGVVTAPSEEDEPTTAPTEATTAPTEPEPTEKPDDVTNILLIGQDSRGGGRGRSDSMILCSVNMTDKTITLTSFMRDLYVEIPNSGGNRLNAAFAYGGVRLLNETLKANYGLEVDANIEVDFEGFKNVINRMGGVTVSLTADEVDYMDALYDGLVVGSNVLYGDAALTYARIRSIDSDFQRTSRQRTVLNALFEKIRYADMELLLAVIDTMLPVVRTDMTDAQILGYALKFGPVLSEFQLINQRVPLDGAYRNDTIRGMAVLVTDPDTVRELLEKTTK